MPRLAIPCGARRRGRNYGPAAGTGEVAERLNAPVLKCVKKLMAESD